MAAIYQAPASAWRRIELEGVSRLYKTPRILDQHIRLPHYQGELRQLAILDLGHEEPTLLLTTHRRRSPATLIARYAQRMVIENQIAEGIKFFHMDALSSALAMKVNCDLQLTIMASSLYRLLGAKVGNGYADAKADHIFRDLVDATALVTLSDTDIQVRFQKRAHNPLLLAAGLASRHGHSLARREEALSCVRRMNGFVSLSRSHGNPGYRATKAWQRRNVMST